MAGPRAHAQWRATLHDGGTRTAHRDCKNQSCESRSLHLNECRGGGGAGPWRTLNLTASRAISSAGRAPPRQGGGHWFEPSIAHRTPRVAQDCRAPQLQCLRGRRKPVQSRAASKPDANPNAGFRCVWILFHRENAFGHDRSPSSETGSRWKRSPPSPEQPRRTIVSVSQGPSGPCSRAAVCLRAGATGGFCRSP